MPAVASPSVRKDAADRGIDLEDLAARLGRETIAKEDLVTAPSAPPSASTSGPWEADHAAHGPVRSEPVSRFAQLAAQTLGAAQTVIPAVTHHDKADVSALEAFRASLKGEAAERGVKLTALAFHVAALGHCLQLFERFNASLSADGQSLILKDYVHVGIAVDTPHGLMVPVVRDVPTKGLWQIAEEIADLAARANARKVRPEEMGGASMSISNLGGIGGDAFTPMVNPPEVAILGLTRVETVPVWDGKTFVPRPMVPLHLTYDHRVVNGADAARFLRAYADLIADPRRLLV